MIGHACTRAVKRYVFAGKGDDGDAGKGKNARCWWFTADPSPARRPTAMRRYAWEFVAFDDQEVGVPAPHNSALARAYICLRSLVDRDRTSPHSRLELSQVG